jgi:Flp pilus assembly protein TadD
MIGSSVLLALAVLANGSAVVMPFVFLILDAYPLRRLVPGVPFWRTVGQLLIEKGPMLVFCVAVTGVAFAAKGLGVEPEVTAGPVIIGRMAQASFGACFYLAKTVWPFGITAFYPRPEGGNFLSPVFAACAAGVVLAVSAAIWQRKRRPWLLAAVAAYLVIALPYLGLARVGITLAADRYSYAPTIAWVVVACAGLCVVATRRWPRTLLLGAGASTLVLAGGLMALCSAQCRVWDSTEHLFGHALSYAPWSPELHDFMGTTLGELGKFEQARAELREALRLRPNYFEATYDLGVLLDRHGETEEAIKYLREAASLRPKDAMAHVSLGGVLVQQGHVDEAVALYREALELRPNFPNLHYSLGVALIYQQRIGEAINELTKAVELRPWYTEAYAAVGGALVLLGRQDEAVVQYKKALQIDPNHSASRIGLGLALARLGRSAEAITQLRTAVQRDRLNPEAHHVLASVLVALGRIPEATAEYGEVLRLRPDHAQARAFLARAPRRRL